MPPRLWSSATFVRIVDFGRRRHSNFDNLRVVGLSIKETLPLFWRQSVMAFFRRRRRYAGRRRAFRQFRRRGRRVMRRRRRGLPRIPRSLITPPMIRRRLRYAEYFGIDPPAASYADYHFRTSSIFDPNETSTGHKPIGTAALFALYIKATVVSMRWIVRVQDVPDAPTVPFNWGAMTTEGTIASPTAGTVIIEQPGVQYRTIIAGTATSPSGFGRPISGKWVQRNNLRENIFSTDLVNTVSAGPALTQYLRIFVQGAAFGADVATVRFLAVLTYDCIFWERGFQDTS